MDHDEDLHHQRAHELDHSFDYDDRDKYLEEERILREGHKIMKEVHHPYEDIDYGSYEDMHRHYYPRDTYDHPREFSDRTMHFPHHDRRYLHGGYYGGYYSNGMPMNKDDRNGAPDNVLDDDDPAICFVKAYARKPLGLPKVQPGGQKSNHMDYYNDDDEWFDDEDYDNYGDYDDYSNSEDEYYYDEEDNSSEDNEEESSEEEEETSSEEEESDDANQFDALDFNMTDDHWDSDRHYGAYKHHPQYFDLTNQEGGQPSPSDSEEDSQESSEEESSDDANAYGRRRHRAPAHGAHRRAAHPHPARHTQ